MPRPLPEPANHQPVVLLVLLSGVSLSDLTSCPAPAIRSLMTSGAVGLMNTRTGSGQGRLRRGIDSLVLHPEEVRPTTLESGCLTLGAGTRCFARSEAGMAFDADEPVTGSHATSLWQQRTGLKPGRDRVYHVAIPRLMAGNQRHSYAAAPGALGQALREAGLLAAVVGNADDVHGRHREAACIAMDALGRVPLGSVGGAFSRPDPLAPGGYTTDARAVTDATLDALRAGARLVVIETGDTARTERANDDVQADLRPLRRREALMRADQIVASLLRHVDPNEALLLLVAPAVSLDAARAGTPLAPVVMAGKGVTRGLLLSPSTRTPGLCTNTDIAPTVLHFLGVRAPAQMVGRPLTSHRDIYAPETLLALEERFRRVESYARPMMRRLVWLQTALFGVFLFAAWAYRGVPPTSPVYAGALGLAALPLAILLTAAILPGTPGSGLFLLLLLDALLVAVAHSLRRLASPIGLLFLANTAVLAADLCAGAHLLRASALGYSPYGGARYYGMGNEGFGCLAASLLFAIAFLWPQARRTPSKPGATRRPGSLRMPILVVSAFSLAAAVLVGHPQLGANFGGAVSAGAASVAAAILALRERLSRRGILVLVMGGIVIAALPFLFELLSGGGSPSHIGRAMEGVREGGLGTAWGIIHRKLSMNWLLLRRSPWSRLLLLAGLTAVYLAHRNREALRQRAPVVQTTASIAVIAAAAALVANDSGVLPAAEIIVATAAALLACTARFATEERDAPHPPTTP